MAERIVPERVAELTAALVAVPSHEDETAVQDLLDGLFSGLGFACQRHEVAPGRMNLLAVRGSGGPFLCSHADMHPPHDHPDPFICRLEDGVLVGRGVVDAKGQIAALLGAVEAAPDAPATILITCDEERGGQGSEHLALPADVRPESGGVVLEPTGFEICVAQSGCIELRLDARSSPGHAHSSEPPVSALDVVLGAVEALDGCSFLSERHPLLPVPRRYIGTMSGGEHLWRTAAHARSEVALTLLPGVDADAARAEVTEILDALALAWRGRDTQLHAEIIDVSEPIEVPHDLPAIERLQTASAVPLALGGMPSWTDAGNLLVHHRIPCVVFGAGDLAQAHGDHEQVRLDDLVTLAEILRRYLEFA